MQLNIEQMEKITKLDTELTQELQELFEVYADETAALTNDSPHNRILIALVQTALAKAAYNYVAKQGVGAEEALSTVALLTGNAMEAWFLKALSQQNLSLEGINVQKLN